MGLSVKDIETLNYPEVIAKRPSMYLGAQARNANSPGQKNVCCREIIDNSVTEALKGYADHIDITFYKNGFVECVDNGRGLPTDIDKETGINGFIKTIATLHSGGAFKETDGLHGSSLNGVGASAVNAVSARFDVKVFKNNRMYFLSFKNGHAGQFKEGDNSANAEFIESDKIKSVAYQHERGTSIRFKLNDIYFSPVDNIIVDDIIDRLRYTVYLIPDLTITVNDKTRNESDGGGKYTFTNEGDLPGMLEFVDNSSTIITGKGDEYQKKGIFSVSCKGKYTERYVDVSGRKTVVKDRTNHIPIDVAFKFNNEDISHILSFANTIGTLNGGVHEEALKNSLVDTFGKHAQKINKTKNTILPEDVLTNLSAVISINVSEPQFSSQAKVKLSGKNVEDAVYSALVKEFNRFIKNDLNEKQFSVVCKRIVDNAKIRTASEVAKVTKKKSLIKKSPANLPSKLKECRCIGDELSELYLSEGDSAAGSILAARDADYQAVIPLRGKILNVLKLDFSKKKQRERFEKNAEINDIIKALGAGVGEHFDLDKLRYGKVVFAADSDVDGYSINTLLLGLFYKLFRPMIEDGRVYQCLTPLFEIKYKQKGKEVVEYAADESERMEIEKKLKAKNIKYRIDRNKGLGELDADIFSDYVMNPANRRLIKITIDDAEAADHMINLAIGSAPPDDRKEWMLNHTEVIDNLGLYE